MEKLVQNKYQQQGQQTGIQFGPPNMKKPPNIPTGTIAPTAIPLIDAETGKVMNKINVRKRKPKPGTNRAKFIAPRTDSEAFWNDVENSNKFAKQKKQQQNNQNNRNNQNNQNNQNNRNNNNINQ